MIEIDEIVDRALPLGWADLLEQLAEAERGRARLEICGEIALQLGLVREAASFRPPARRRNRTD